MKLAREIDDLDEKYDPPTEEERADFKRWPLGDWGVELHASVDVRGEDLSIEVYTIDWCEEIYRMRLGCLVREAIRVGQDAALIIRALELVLERAKLAAHRNEQRLTLAPKSE